MNNMFKLVGVIALVTSPVNQIIGVDKTIVEDSVNEEISASDNDEIILDDAILEDKKEEEVNDPHLVDEETNDNHDDFQTENQRSQETENYIKDDYLRSVINYKLRRDFEPNYRPTMDELKSITSLDIKDESYRRQYLYIEDLSGLEYLTSLESLKIFQTFIPGDIFSITATLPNLVTFEFVNSYIVDGDSTITLNGKTVNTEYVDRMSFNPILRLGDLGASNSLENLEVWNSQAEMFPNYQQRARGILHVAGLERLSTLKNLHIDTFADVDDKNMNFVKGLQNLETLLISDVPFENIDSVNSLPSTTKIDVDWTNVTDYSNVTHPNLTNSSFTHDLFVTQRQGYKYQNDKFTTNYNTGLIIPSDASNVVVKVGNEAKLNSFEILDKSLYLNVEMDALKSYSLYNPVTNTSDIKVKGFRYTVSYTLSNGKDVEYELLLANLAESVRFEIVSDEDIKPLDVLVNDEGKVSKPNETDFNLNGYKIEGWYTDKNFTEEVDFNKVINESTTYYGKITKIEDKYTVTFDSNGGTHVDAITDVLTGNLIDRPVNPTKDGYEFGGWMIDHVNNILWNFDEDKVTEDITLTAHWVLKGGEDVKPNPDPGVPNEPDKPSNPDKPAKPADKDISNQKPNTGIETSYNQYLIISVIATLALVTLFVVNRKSREQ